MFVAGEKSEKQYKNVTAGPGKEAIHYANRKKSG